MTSKNKFSKVKIFFENIFWLVIGAVIAIIVNDLYQKSRAKMNEEALIGDEKPNIGFHIDSWWLNQKLEQTTVGSLAKDVWVPKQIQISYDFYARNITDKQLQFEDSENLNANFPSDWKKIKVEIIKSVEGKVWPNDKQIFLEPGQVFKIIYVVFYKIPYGDPKKFNSDIENLSEYLQPTMTYQVSYPNNQKIDIDFGKTSLREEVNEMYVASLNQVQDKIDEVYLKNPSAFMEAVRGARQKSKAKETGR